MARATRTGSLDQSRDFVDFPVTVGPDIASAAARIGQYVWVSARLFEIVGAWAGEESESRRKADFAEVAGRFAWQAGEWRQRLPRLREVDVDRLVVAPPGHRLDDLAGVPVAERHVALASVVTRLDATYRTHAAAASPLRDTPLVHAVERIRADLAAIETRSSDI